MPSKRQNQPKGVIIKEHYRLPSERARKGAHGCG